MAASTTLLKHLVAAGIGARRASAALIVGGRVAINGLISDSLTQPISVTDNVTVDGNQVTPGPTTKTYLMAHKPGGYLSTVTDPRGRPTVLNLVPIKFRAPGLVPAGRLDMPTTGLIVLTNDGDLVNQLTHPRYGVEKEYQAILDSPLAAASLRALVSGVPLPSGVARAVRANPLPGQPCGYTVVMTEGRKREVRLMMEALGRVVRSLRRVRVGGLRLGDLEPGRVRALDPGDLKKLRQKGVTTNETHSGSHRGMAGSRERRKTRGRR